MTTTSAWLRPLQALTVVLGIAIAALLVAWFRSEVPPLSFAAETPQPAPQPTSAVTGEVGSPRSVAEEAPAPSRVPADAGVTAPAATAAVLYGTIKRADGIAIESGFCFLQRDGKQSGTARLDQGAFAFAGLQPGEFRLTTRIPDELGLEREVVVQAPTTRLDIELLPRWLLRVDAVTADGAPLVEELQKQKRGMLFRTLRALAFAAPLEGDLSGSSAEREAGLGPFRSNDPIMRERGERTAPLPKQTVGVLTLPSDHPAHVALLLGGTLLAQQPATPGQEAITFVVGCDAVFGKLGTVRLRWIDANGAPVAGAPVIVSSGSGSSRGPKQMTDEDGRYTASDLLPGRVGFGVHRQGLIAPPLRIELAPGANLDLGDITMQKAVELELSFENFDGEGGVSFFWLDAAPNSLWQPTENYRPAQTARLQKASLFPGRYALIARSKSGVAITEIDTRSVAPGPMRFDLLPGAPLQIDNRIGTSVARLEIATARGLPVHQSELGSRRSFTVQLPPGDYVATVREGNGEPKRHAFRLPAAGTVLAVP